MAVPPPSFEDYVSAPLRRRPDQMTPAEIDVLMDQIMANMVSRYADPVSLPPRPVPTPATPRAHRSTSSGGPR